MKKLLLPLFAVLVAMSVSGAEKAMKVMTFNVRCVVEADGLNQWKNRKDYAVDLVKVQSPDIWGSQEATHQQMLDLQAGLPDYAYVGVGRTDGKTEGEYSPIFYKKDRFELMESGFFWLAEAEKMNTPGALGWDADYPRIATWGIFYDKQNKTEFFFLNTHLDHMGVDARHYGAKLVLDFARTHCKGLPVIVTGDFNAEPADEPIQVLTKTGGDFLLTDSRTIARTDLGPVGTFHDFGRIPFDERPRLDYIFLNGNMEVEWHAVLTDNQGPLFPSDHHPLIAKILF